MVNRGHGNKIADSRALDVPSCALGLAFSQRRFDDATIYVLDAWD
jgi:hypothetical protein